MSNEIITNVGGIYCRCCLFLSRGCGPAGAEAAPRSDRERGLWSPKDQGLSGKSVNYQAISSRSLYVVSWMVAPQNICPPRTYKCELIWKKGLCTKWRVFKWDHPGLCRWALNPMTRVLIRERQRSIRGPEKRRWKQYGEWGRPGGMRIKSSGTTDPGSHQPLGQGPSEHLSEPQETNPRQHLHFRRLTSSCERIHFGCFVIICYMTAPRIIITIIMYPSALISKMWSHLTALNQRQWCSVQEDI